MCRLRPGPREAIGECHSVQKNSAQRSANLSELSGQGSCLFTQACQLSTFSRVLERHPAGGNQRLDHVTFCHLISFHYFFILLFLSHSCFFCPYLTLVWKWPSGSLLSCVRACRGSFTLSTVTFLIFVTWACLVCARVCLGSQRSWRECCSSTYIRF